MAARHSESGLPLATISRPGPGIIREAFRVQSLRRMGLVLYRRHYSKKIAFPGESRDPPFNGSVAW